MRSDVFACTLPLLLCVDVLHAADVLIGCSHMLPPCCGQWLAAIPCDLNLPNGQGPGRDAVCDTAPLHAPAHRAPFHFFCSTVFTHVRHRTVWGRRTVKHSCEPPSRLSWCGPCYAACIAAERVENAVHIVQNKPWAFIGWLGGRGLSKLPSGALCTGDKLALTQLSAPLCELAFCEPACFS